MISRVAAVLDRLSQRDRFTAPEDLVFPNDVGRHFDDSKLRKRYIQALERAGLRRPRFHDLRHTFGTLAVRAYPLADVKAYMGHADISTTMIYVHHVPQHDAADRLEAALSLGADPRGLGHESGHIIPGKTGEGQLRKAL